MTKYLRVGLETGDYGSGTVTGSDPIKITDISKDISRNEMIEETTDNPLVNTASVGAFTVSGSVGGLFRPTQMVNLIKGLTGDTTSPYTLHPVAPLVFYIGEDFRSVAYEQKISGVGITSATFSFEAKEFVKASFDFIGRVTDDTGTYTLPTYASEVPVTFYLAAIYRGSVDPANKITFAKSMELTIDRKLADDQIFIGDYLLDALVPTGAAEITGSMSFGERQFGEIRAAVYGDSAATTLVNNLEDIFVIVVECKDKAGAVVATFNLNATLYTEVSDSKSGKAEADKSISFRVTDTAVGTAGFSLDI